ncbi:hypothetical protein OCU04_001959 [Sclerotinia nivalis]|uniref:Uncharacterized protein n=1 Tax=Sclerotinia nivalis TaxID=352851 RepID=A0A9X0AZ55_9HELO|nr:hypothetical protein OCU04_001959 [Sclerotinia nivalis]
MNNIVLTPKIKLPFVFKKKIAITMAMVLYDAALAAARADQNPVLFIGGQQLLPFCHNPLQYHLGKGLIPIPRSRT